MDGGAAGAAAATRGTDSVKAISERPTAAVVRALPVSIRPLCTATGGWRQQAASHRRDRRVALAHIAKPCGSIGQMARRSSKSVRRARALSRLVGALMGGAFGTLYGAFIISNSQGVLNHNRSVATVALIAAGLAGATSLALAAPLLSVEPYLWLEETLDEAPASQILSST